MVKCTCARFAFANTCVRERSLKFLESPLVKTLRKVCHAFCEIARKNFDDSFKLLFSKFLSTFACKYCFYVMKSIIVAIDRISSRARIRLVRREIISRKVSVARFTNNKWMRSLEHSVP